MIISSIRFLAVCTGNICRSPAIERILANDLPHQLAVSSAGTHAVVAAPIAQPMAALLRADGVDVSGFAARQLCADLIIQADLILTATATHRNAVVETAPAAMSRTFTLLEFAHALEWNTGHLIGEPFSAQRLADLIMAAHQARPLMGVMGSALDLPDPWGGTDAVYRDVFDLIRPACETVIAALGATDDQSGDA
ncbi:MAG: hypothetical protein LBV06_11125 [Propionibacteriaceae bacterium]|nr:hypothetical protein [Propionibacteriaceae bacterium]